MSDKVIYNKNMKTLSVFLDDKDAIKYNVMKFLLDGIEHEGHKLSFNSYSGSDGAGYSLRVGPIGRFSWDILYSGIETSGTMKEAVKNARKLLDDFYIGTREKYHKRLDEFESQAVN